MTEKERLKTPLSETRRNELTLRMREIPSKDAVTPDELIELVWGISQVALDVDSPEELRGVQINLPNSDHRKIEITLGDSGEVTDLDISLIYGAEKDLQFEDFQPQVNPRNVDSGDIIWHQVAIGSFYSQFFQRRMNAGDLDAVVADEPLNGTDLAKLAKEVYGAYQEGLPNPNPATEA